MSITQIEKNEIFCSVVMPVHNGERFLREAIESILAQTYTNFELLIIENCSSDSSVEIIKSYNDPRIKLIVEENCGQVQAYNRGFGEVKGEYVFIHDQDDVSHPERFEKQLECMLKKNVDICGSYFNLIDANGEVIEKMIPADEHSLIVKELLYKNYTIFNSSVCIKKTVFKEIGFFNKEFYPSADYEFYLRGIGKAIYGNVPEFLYSWRRHSGQISSREIKKITDKTVAISLMNKKKFPVNQTITYEGLVYYYNDKLLKAFGRFSVAFIKDEISRLLLRYFFILLFFGFPLKVFRRFNWVYSPFFSKIKKIF